MITLIFGGKGMLGHKLVQALNAKLEVWTTIKGKFSDVEHFGLFDRDRTIEMVEVTDIGSVRRAIETAKPDVVINAVGVIKQLPASRDTIRTLLINSVFPQHLDEMSREYGFRLMTVSTDCVFSGAKGGYSEADLPDAEDIYGISKFLGEVRNERALTIRTSIIGRELATSYSLVEWFLSNRGADVKGYINAVYTGFPTIVLAEIISGIIVDHPQLNGLYHVSSDPINKFELLILLNKYYRANVRIEPSEGLVVDKSLDSSVFRMKTGFSPPPWEQMVERMASDPTPYEDWRRV